MNGVNYNESGHLLEQLASIGNNILEERRLFHVVSDIRSMLVEIYADERGVKKLETQLANRENLNSQELEIIARGVKDELRHRLEQHPTYSPDTVNEVFIALHRFLSKETDRRGLQGVTDYRRGDNIKAELAGLIDEVNIYYVLSLWISNDQRTLLTSLNRDEQTLANKQFGELKRCSGDFISSLRSLLRHSYNLETSYKKFTKNPNWETYQSTVEVVNGTIIDCKRIVSESESRIKDGCKNVIFRFAQAIYVNAQYHFLQMGYDMLNIEVAKSTIPDPKTFEGELARIAYDPLKIEYFSLMPNGHVTVDRSIKKLSHRVRDFYNRIKVNGS